MADGQQEVLIFRLCLMIKKTGSGVVMGAYKVDESTSHAVIFESYSDGVYTYYDPSTGNRGSVSDSDVLGAIKATGLREEETGDE